MTSDTDIAIPLRKARGVGDVINVTFSFIRQNARLLGKSLLFIVGPLMALMAILSSTFQVSFFTLNPEQMDRFGASFWLSYLGVIVVSLLAMALALAVVLGFVMLYQEHGPGGFDLRAVWEVAKAYFLRMLGTMLGVGLIIFGVYIIAVMLIMGGAIGLIQAGGGGEAVVGGMLVVVLFLAMLCLMVYALVTLSLLFPVRIREEVGFWSGLGRCRRLVRGRFWATFGVLFLAGVLYSVLSLIFSVPALIVGGVYGFNTLEGGGPGVLIQIGMFIAGAVNAVGSTVLYCIPLVALAFQYFSLVEQKEHAGLRDRVEQVAGRAALRAPTAASEEVASEGTVSEGRAVEPPGDAFAPPERRASDEKAENPEDDERRWGPHRAE